MNEEYFKEQARRVREIAEMADPFTKRRLLDLASTYERRPRPLAPLPSLTVQKHPNHNRGSRDTTS
jgi:hypothetical protein